MAVTTDARLEALSRLKDDPEAASARAELEKALRGRSSIVTAKAAAIAESAKLEALEPALVAAFERFLTPGSDKGCLAKTAIAKALHAAGSRAEAMLFVGARHVQMEGTWGGLSDVAVELRGVCAAALVNMRSRRAMEVLIHLLADPDAAARVAGVRSLAAHGGDAAEALVQYKLLVGDREAGVVAECMPAAVALTRSTHPVEPFLDSPDEGLREAAILTIGESRLPRAFDVLRARWDAELDPNIRRLLAMSIGLTRQTAAVEFLVQQVEQGDVKSAVVAVEALGLYRHDDALRERVRKRGHTRGGEVWKAVLAQFTS